MTGVSKAMIVYLRSEAGLARILTYRTAKTRRFRSGDAEKRGWRKTGQSLRTVVLIRASMATSFMRFALTKKILRKCTCFLLSDRKRAHSFGGYHPRLRLDEILVTLPISAITILFPSLRWLNSRNFGVPNPVRSSSGPEVDFPLSKSLRSTLCLNRFTKLRNCLPPKKNSSLSGLLFGGSFRLVPRPPFFKVLLTFFQRTLCKSAVYLPF